MSAALRVLGAYVVLSTTLAVVGCRCAPGEDWIPRGERLQGAPPGEDLDVGNLEAGDIASDEGVLVFADVEKVDVGSDGALAWGRAHFVVSEVLRGTGLAAGTKFTQLYRCEIERTGRGPPVGWAQCPDRNRRFALRLTATPAGWNVASEVGGLDATEVDGLRSAANLRKGNLPSPERAKRLGEAVAGKSKFLRRFARNELRYATDLPREAAERALLDAAPKIADWDERASMLDAAAERLPGVDDEPTETDRELLQSVTRSFVDGANDAARSRGFQTLYFALNPGVTDQAVKAKLVAKRLGIARRVDPAPERVIAALRAFEGRGGLTNGERDLIVVYQSGAPPPPP